MIGNILASLYALRDRGSVGTAKLAYVVPELPSGRESFSPAASYFTGPRPMNRMGPVLGPPTFAVELTFSNPDAVTDPADAARKRGDYFAAGTLVV